MEYLGCDKVNESKTLSRKQVNYSNIILSYPFEISASVC